ncbi:MAG: carboxypeptidase-like regulatory domain-containing protein [Pyrinomonadaceae bacterium]
MQTKQLTFRPRNIIQGIVITLFLSICIFAQTDTATITGSVTDAQGAAIAGATVKITNMEKAFSRSAQTNDSGSYNFPGIPPGSYTVEIEKGGFKKSLIKDVKAPISNSATINVSLEVGDVAEVVTVTGGTLDSIINTQDASIGNNFQPIQIQQLPTDSRNITALLSLQPGVTREGYVNGGRSDQANITLDGVDVNDQQTGAAFSPVLRSLAEATEEFRVTTTNANADQGRSSGAQISLLTKGGSNQFHGVGFWLPRRTAGSANDFFNNATVDVDTGKGIPRPNINRDVFGGAIGGPIVKEKLFFFYAYEGWRQNVDVPVIQTVPLANLGQGIIRISPTVSVTAAEFGTLYPGLVTAQSPNGQNPIGLAVLAAAAARYPANSRRAGDGLNTGGFSFNAPSSYTQATHILRLDWALNANHQLFGRANKQNDVTNNPPPFPDALSTQDWEHNTGGMVGHTWTIGTNKVNNFRYGLTRQAFTIGGNSTSNSQSFRFVYNPTFAYGLSRVTPIHNLTDDFTWIKGSHTLQFGGNVRLIKNRRVDEGAGYDNAVINPSYYASSGRSLLNPLAGPYGVATNNLDLQAAVAAVIGRYSQYTANYNYDLAGNVLPGGTPIRREFATEEYDMYIQDSWKIRSNLSVNLGLRYGLSRPVYETSGYQIRPDIPLGEYFDSRVAGSNAGTPYNRTLNFELAGPKNNAKGWYDLDKNNFQPRVSAAWSPGFKTGFLSKVFGADNESVFRGGFAITNDYFGQQLAVTFNGLGTLGFLTSDTIAPNTYGVSASNRGPLFTGFGQQVNNLPGMAPLANRFVTPADEDTRIEFSLDSTLKSPINYSWSFSYGRKLPKGMYIEASYVGRKARNLLVQRDIMAPNNLVDKVSKTDWYTAANGIYNAYYAGQDYSTVAAIPYFENMFPSLIGYLGPGTTATQTVAWANQNFAFGDWTYLQLLLDDCTVFDSSAFCSANAPNWANLYYQPQYAAFAAFSTAGKSDYHGGSISVRQRLGTALSYDFNYTFSKSMDDASGLQTSGAYGAAFVLNPLRQQDSYSLSDFDTRHVINANFLYQLPFGKGRFIGTDSGKWKDALIGGWQLGGIFRWNSGLPFNNLIDLAGWATNWNLRSSVVRTAPIQSSFTRNGDGGTPNIFSNLELLRNSVRPARPGETGDRNVFTGNSFSQLDMNLGKTFDMPWKEGHQLQFRWEVFNVLNMQYLDENTASAFSISPADPFGGVPSSLSGGTGTLTGMKGIPRRMQFVFRYSF